MPECHTRVHEAVSMETTMAKSIKCKGFPFTKGCNRSLRTNCSRSESKRWITGAWFLGKTHLGTEFMADLWLFPLALHLKADQLLAQLTVIWTLPLLKPRSTGGYTHPLQGCCHGNSAVSWQGVQDNAPGDDQGDSEGLLRRQLSVCNQAARISKVWEPASIPSSASWSKSEALAFTCAGQSAGNKSHPFQRSQSDQDLLSFHLDMEFFLFLFGRVRFKADFFSLIWGCCCQWWLPLIYEIHISHP